jgi:Pyruvate/2-oxoacid:ferredoxin oxidoreductase delta subunit
MVTDKLISALISRYETGVTVSASLVLSVALRSKAEVHHDQLVDCANCDVDCPEWCLARQRTKLNARWSKYFR